MKVAKAWNKIWLIAVFKAKNCLKLKLCSRHWLKVLKGFFYMESWRKFLNSNKYIYFLETETKLWKNMCGGARSLCVLMHENIFTSNLNWKFTLNLKEMEPNNSHGFENVSTIKCNSTQSSNKPHFKLR